jgi:hypothetical protein
LEGLKVEEEAKKPDPVGIFDWESNREHERGKVLVVQDLWVWGGWGLANTWKDAMKLQRRSSNYFDIIRMEREGIEKAGG